MDAGADSASWLGQEEAEGGRLHDQQAVSPAVYLGTH